MGRAYMRAVPDFASRSFIPRRGRRVVAVSSTATESPKILELGDTIAGLTLEEARKLVDHLQEWLSITAAGFAPAAVVAAPGAGDAGAAKEEASVEKTEFDIIIDEVPSSACIASIKVVHALTSLALTEAKDLVFSVVMRWIPCMRCHVAFSLLSFIYFFSSSHTNFISSSSPILTSPSLLTQEGRAMRRRPAGAAGAGAGAFLVGDCGWCGTGASPADGSGLRRRSSGAAALEPGPSRLTGAALGPPRPAGAAGAGERQERRAQRWALHGRYEWRARALLRRSGAGAQEGTDGRRSQ